MRPPVPRPLHRQPYDDETLRPDGASSSTSTARTARSRPAASRSPARDAARVLATEHARLIVFGLPAGQERYFRALSRARAGPRAAAAGHRRAAPRRRHRDAADRVPQRGQAARRRAVRRRRRGPAMPATARIITNPVTGEELTWLVTAAQSGGRLVKAEVRVHGAGRGARLPHAHPCAHETFTVMRGRMAIERGGEVAVLAPGESLTVAPGVEHAWWNARAGELCFHVEVSPPGPLRGADRARVPLGARGPAQRVRRPRPDPRRRVPGRVRRRHRLPRPAALAAARPRPAAGAAGPAPQPRARRRRVGAARSTSRSIGAKTRRTVHHRAP